MIMCPHNGDRLVARRLSGVLCLIFLGFVQGVSGGTNEELEAAAYRIRQVKYAVSGVDIGYTTSPSNLANVLKGMTVRREEHAPEQHYLHHDIEVGPLNRQLASTNFQYLPSNPTVTQIVEAAATLNDIVSVTGATVSNSSVSYNKYGHAGALDVYYSCEEAWATAMTAYASAEEYTNGWWPTGPIQEMSSGICAPWYSPGLGGEGYTASIWSRRTSVRLVAPVNNEYGASKARVLEYLVGTFGNAAPGSEISMSLAAPGGPQQPDCPGYYCLCCSNVIHEVNADLSLYARVEMPTGDDCGSMTYSHCSGGACGSGIPRVGVDKQSLSVKVEDRPAWVESGAGPKLEIAMSFDSRDATFYTNGVFGRGWRWDYEGHIASYGADGARRVILPNGRVLHFFFDGFTNGSYAYSGPPSSAYDLAGLTDGTFRLNKEIGGGYGFSATNIAGISRLSYVEDRYGNRLEVKYDGNGLITNISDAAGNFLAVAYDGQNHIILVTNSAGASASFAYTNGLLASVVDMGGNSYSYQYATNGSYYITNVQTEAGATTIDYGNGTEIRVQNAAGDVEAFGFLSTNFMARYEVNGRGYTNWVYHTNSLRGWVRTREVDALGNETSYSHDSLGRVVAVTNALGLVTSYTYDDFDNVLTEIGPLGLSNSYAYSTDGLDRLSAVDSLGNRTTYDYDTNHNLVAITNALDGVTSYAYSNGLKTAETDPNGLTILYCYDSYQQLTQTVSSAGETNSFSYDARGRLAVQKRPSGLSISNAYDGLNRVISRSYPDGTKETFTYDCCGLIAETNRLGRGTMHQYDAVGRRISTTDPLGNTTTYRLDANGNVEVVSNSLGYVESTTYDALNRPVGKTYANSTGTIYSEEFSYDPLGRMTNLVNRRGHVRTFEYDALGRRTSAIAGATSVVETLTYDALGRVITQHGENGVLVSNQYDAVGRLCRTCYPDGTYIENLYSYASNGLYATRDQLGQYTSYSRDDAGRVTAVRDPLGRVVQYQYDFAGRMTTLTDPNGNETGFQYDFLNNLVAKTYADESTWQYAYDPNNNLTNTINGRGEYIRYAYGPLNNLLSILSSNLFISLSYDILGRVTSRVDSAGTTLMRYGDLVHLTEADGPFPNDTITYSYDGDLKKTVALNGNQLVEYEWDFLDRLSQVAAPTGTFTYVYDGVRRTPKEIQYPSGAKVLRSMDDLARLASLSNYYSGGSAISACAYVYDSAGRRTRETRLGGEYIDYGYDLAGQLTSAVKRLPGGQPAPGYEYFYTYDPAGNMLTNVGNGLKIAMTYNNLNQLVSRGWGANPTSIVVWGSASPIVTSATVNALGADLQSNGSFVATSVSVGMGTNTLAALGRDIYGRVATNVSRVVLAAGRAFTYDASGNLLSDGYFSNTWNVLDQQSAYGSGSNRMEFTYDGVGRRVEKKETLGGVTNVTRYVWDGWVPLAILNASNALVEINVWGLDLSGSLEEAGGIGGLLCIMAPGSPDPMRECFSNGRGDVTDLSAGGTNTFARYEYEPFGASLGSAGRGSSRYRFSSKEMDEVSGSYYYGYRFYSPTLGRWLSRDPVLEKAFQETRLLIGGIAKEQLDLRRWQMMLVMKGHLLKESVGDGGIVPSEDRSQLAYAFVENSPVGRIDVLGLGYCGSAGNEPWVPEFWFGGENGPCHKHDQCYGTCGYSQEYCNGLFFADMVRACPLWPPEATATCLAVASWYYAFVQNLGNSAFCAAQEGCCPKGKPLWGSCP